MFFVKRTVCAVLQATVIRGEEEKKLIACRLNVPDADPQVLSVLHALPL